ncbi:hypothetical protein J437_LFUL004168 [Ladona fulva]|uniref:Reverse transcriptase n=1 Tax=Ladona fulva TaxID=123851 RepID=A0A8K0K1F7_LADFU|nr:hypothetical protein J437_LFUL004168 [Ladona fulva]
MSSTIVLPIPTDGRRGTMKSKQLVDRRISGDESLLRPDLLISEGPNGPMHILDITVPLENRPDALKVARETKRWKYPDLAERLRVEVSLDAIVVGALGTWDPENDNVLQRLRIPKRKMTTLQHQAASAAIKWFRDIYVEHVTGVRQY